ncbi:MAG TPA: SbcC/MukB-like Walker B domain-containing protein, partial [Acidimicrobiales bacterium]
DHVASLDQQVAATARQVEASEQRQGSAHEALDRARRQAGDDLATLRTALDDLTRLAVNAGLTARVPDVPDVEARSTGGDGGPAPVGRLDADPLRSRLAGVRASARARSGDVAEVRRSLHAVDAAAAKLDATERALADATAAEQAAATAFRDARAHADQAVVGWRGDLEAWLARLDDHRRSAGLGPADRAPLAAPDLAGARDEVAAALLDAAQATLDHHRQVDATLRARRTAEQAVVDELAARLDELQRRTLPDPPAGPWQRRDRSACLADLVDFRAGLDDATRAGLEAAMEAAGLLGAELAGDGSLALAGGQLVVRPGKPADQPLSALLAVTIPDDLAGTVDAHRVERVLDTISTSADDLTGDTELTVATVDGRFRTGMLRGRHAKATAEHIGVTARRAALERQRAQVAAELAGARAAVDRTDAAIADRGELIAEATGLRRDLPPAAPVTDAIVRAEHAERRHDEAREQRRARHEARNAAEAAHAEAVDASRRLAATLLLPAEPAELDAVDRAVRETTAGCDRIEHAVETLVRSVGHWTERAAAYEQAVDDRAAAEAQQRAVGDRRERMATKLATLEDTVGLEYDEIVATLAVSERDLEQTTGVLDQAREARLDAHGLVERRTSEAETAAATREAAEARCVAALTPLREALAVPGLVASALAGSEPDPDRDPTGAAGPGDGGGATSPPDSDLGGGSGGDDGGAERGPGDGGDGDGGAETHAAVFPAVAETPDGVRELASAIATRIPAPGGTETTADGVRQSLRQRRDALGAGWDAEDRQPDETLPLHVEVTGPLGRMPLPQALGRVRTQLRSMSSLLSAKQDQALRNLLQGLIAREVAHKLHAARELVQRMNARLDTITTSQGIGVSLRWTRRDDLDPALAGTIGLLAKPPDLRTADEDHQLTQALAARIADARRDDPEAPYRELIARVLDYRAWHRMALYLRRPGRADERISRRTALSEGEKKMVSYLPLFAAVAASCDALAEAEPAAPRFVLLDDAFAKVSEDNHAKLFGLLVELDLDFIATSERLWGTHATVPELAITEVLRDADLGVIVLEHSRWDGRHRTTAA